MPRSLILHPDRLFPAEPSVRDLARSLYAVVADLPVLGASRRIDPEAFATDRPFANATDLIVANDPAVHRLLHSQGVDLKQLGAPGEEEPSMAIPRKAWRLFAHHAKAFRGTTQGLWLDQVFSQVFGLSVRLDGDFKCRRQDDGMSLPPPAESGMRRATECDQSHAGPGAWLPTNMSTNS